MNDLIRDHTESEKNFDSVQTCSYHRKLQSRILHSLPGGGGGINISNSLLSPSIPHL